MLLKEKMLLFFRFLFYRIDASLKIAYRETRHTQLKQALSIFFWVLIFGHILAYFTDPSDSQPKNFILYRFLSIGSYFLLYQFVKKIKKPTQTLNTLLYIALFIVLLWPFLKASLKHPIYIYGVMQLSFCISAFFPIGFTVYTSLAVSLTLFVLFYIKSILLPVYGVILINNLSAGFEVFMFLTICVNYFINRFRLKDFLQRQELQLMQDHLIQQEKMASLGVLTKGIAHEVRNPLVFMKLRLHALIDSLTADDEQKKRVYSENKERLDALQLGMERIEKIVNELQRSRAVNQHDIQSVDVRKEIAGVLTLLSHEHKNRITIHEDYSGETTMQGNTVQISQILMNVLHNSMQAIQGQGEIWIQTASTENDITIRIKDTGCGISKDAMPRIWDTFYTTKANGTGLGLFIVYNAVKNHHGDVTITSEEGKGTECVIRLARSGQLK